jgi:hypothetical protein
LPSPVPRLQFLKPKKWLRYLEGVFLLTRPFHRIPIFAIFVFFSFFLVILAAVFIYIQPKLTWSQSSAGSDDRPPAKIIADPMMEKLDSPSALQLTFHLSSPIVFHSLRLLISSSIQVITLNGVPIYNKSQDFKPGKDYYNIEVAPTENESILKIMFLTSGSDSFFDLLPSPLETLNLLIWLAMLLTVLGMLWLSVGHVLPRYGFLLLAFMTTIALIYTSQKHYLDRQNDTLGFLELIENTSLKTPLPPVKQCLYCYEPPLVAWVAHVIFKESAFYTHRHFLGLLFLNFALYLSFMVLCLRSINIVFNLKSLTRLQEIILYGFILFPGHLMQFARLTNDTYVSLGIIWAIYLFCKNSNGLWIYVASTLSLLAKLNSIVLPVFLSMSYIYQRKYRRAGFSLLLILIPFIVFSFKSSHGVRLEDVPDGTEEKILNVGMTFLPHSGLANLDDPFVSNVTINSTWNYMLKTALFGELRVDPKVEPLRYMIGASTFWLALFSLIVISILLAMKPRGFFENVSLNYLMFLLALALGSLVYFVCVVSVRYSQDFRHIYYSLPLMTLIYLKAEVSGKSSLPIHFFFWSLISIFMLWDITYVFTNSFYYY